MITTNSTNNEHPASMQAQPELACTVCQDYCGDPCIVRNGLRLHDDCAVRLCADLLGDIHELVWDCDTSISEFLQHNVWMTVIPTLAERATAFRASKNLGTVANT